MSARESRRARVQELRTVARACAVELVPDNAARPRVQAMMAAIRSSSGPDAEKASAETAFAAYIVATGVNGFGENPLKNALRAR